MIEGVTQVTHTHTHTKVTHRCTQVNYRHWSSFWMQTWKWCQHANKHSNAESRTHKYTINWLETDNQSMHTPTHTHTESNWMRCNSCNGIADTVHCNENAWRTLAEFGQQCIASKQMTVWCVGLCCTLMHIANVRKDKYALSVVPVEPGGAVVSDAPPRGAFMLMVIKCVSKRLLD